MKSKKKDIVVFIEKPFCVTWSYNKDGKICCDNECISTKYVEKIMKVLVAQSTMRDRKTRKKTEREK